MANIARDIFKAYDIRGIVGKTLTAEAAYLIGKAIATKALEKGITRIALGRDGRLSGPGLMAQIQRGFTDSGIDVIAKLHFQLFELPFLIILLLTF